MATTIADILASKGVIPAAEVPQIKNESRKRGVSLETVLYERGIDEQPVIEAKSEVLAIPFQRISAGKMAFDLLRAIPEESARFYKFVPIGESEGMLEIGMVNPEDVAAQQALKFIASRLQRPFKVFLITPTDFEKILREYQSIGGAVNKALEEFKRENEPGPLERPEIDITKLDLEEEAPISRIVDVIVKHGVAGRASDIHIEPEREALRVRFRVDGLLYTSLNLPTSSHQSIVNRIKILTKMKLDETRVPQDGRFQTQIDGKDVDFRVASLPTPFGEKIAIRILDPQAGVKTLQDLGFQGHNLEMVKTAIKRPFGMILITGPTGSGKSTTLYALLQILNREQVNIISLEDPIEYYIPGLNQSQIRPEIGYDFATGLRNILRQDPDIIMVGEIRDKETAQLAMQAALTGHLVLSTLHTNNAVGVIPRLIDMGVDPYLIPSTLILAVGQRLVRKLCPDSRDELPDGPLAQLVNREISALTGDLAKEVEKKKPWKAYQSKISATCPTGTSGRIGVFETLAMTTELEKIIAEGATESKIQGEAKRQGMITMRQDGILKVLDGIIGVNELLEVT